MKGDMTNPRSTTLRRRKLAFRMNAWTAVFLAAVAAFMLNYIFARHGRRWDVSRERHYSLSDKTKRVLDQLQSGVDITVCFRSESDLLRIQVEDLSEMLSEAGTFF